MYAPNAKEVRLIASFNHFQGDQHVMHQIHFQGVYQIKVAGHHHDAMYKYEIITYAGTVLHKADPFAFYAEKPPHTASKVYELDGYQWHDEDYLTTKKRPYDQPMFVYEVHLGSWRKITDNT